MIGLMIFTFVLLMPGMFFTGILLAIFSERNRKLGLILVLISIVVELIGFSICSSIFRHGFEGRQEEEPIDNEFFILHYMPTSDSLFCDSTQIIPTDFMTGWLYFGDSGRLFNYSLALGEFDSLRIQSGEYQKENGNLRCILHQRWAIPFKSQDDHSFQSLDFSQLKTKRIPYNTFILNQNNCIQFPYYTSDTFDIQKGLVYEKINGNNSRFKDLKYIINQLDNR